MQEENSELATVPGNSEQFSRVSSLVSSNGGADGIRTHDLLDAIEARSQLRHGPTGGTSKSLPQISEWPERRVLQDWRDSMLNSGTGRSAGMHCATSKHEGLGGHCCRFFIAGSGGVPVECWHHGKTYFSRRGGLRDGVKIPCGSGRQEVAGGLRSVSGHG